MLLAGFTAKRPADNTCSVGSTIKSRGTVNGLQASYRRKYAIRVLNDASSSKRPPTTRTGKRVYDEAVKRALILLWEASDRICGRRLKALIPARVEATERHGYLSLYGTVRAKLLTVIGSTIDRLLQPVRAGGTKRMKRPLAVRGHVPFDQSPIGMPPLRAAWRWTCSPMVEGVCLTRSAIR
ncbi:MAG: hypothetical protein ACJATT_005064 [Myxococcota bacterium]